MIVKTLTKNETETAARMAWEDATLIALNRTGEDVHAWRDAFKRLAEKHAELMIELETLKKNIGL